ncbi:Uu.00g139230.m01.CDS01 [Anthostomella pinea]|uniref:Uu.00g139230.m01.CDS01 n=1 Tax=Anthostomella pinea TaxID=933095 RepID=A0AAI8YL87_9PEZI|nr:Uu.00g139230.m01.CDS01 [Anthostomella pinea]
MDTPSTADSVLTIIRRANLPHPDGELLEHYIDDSVDQDQAANYVLKTYMRDGVGKGDVASDRPTRPIRDRDLVDKITRRDRTCRLTGLRGTFLDPLIVVPIFPILDNPLREPLRELLCAFLSPTLRDWVAASSSAEFQHSPGNLWLLRKSAAAAFAQGYYELLIREHESFVSTTFVGGDDFPRIVDRRAALRLISLDDQSGSGKLAPDRSALEVLSRFANSVRWSYIAHNLAANPSSSSRGFLFPNPVTG